MPWITAAAVVGSSLIGKSAASDAAGAQTQATNAATDANSAASRAAIAENKRQFDASQKVLLDQYNQGRSDLAPYRGAGVGALNTLSSMLGVTPDQATMQGPAPDPNSGYGMDPANIQAEIQSLQQQKAANTGPNGEVDPVFDSEIAKAQGQLSSINNYRATPAQPAGQPAPAASADFGSLNQRFQAGTFTPQKFTLADFWDDPVTKASYQSGLDLGQQGINNMAKARGSVNSGATLKALERFGTDYTGQQAAGSEARFTNNQNNAYSRFTNDQNNAYSRFTGDQNTTYNRLSGLAGTGQTATNAGTTLGSNYAGSVAGLNTGSGNTIGGILTNTAGNNANLITGGANARGAAAISGANSITGGVNTALNQYMSQQSLDKILKANGGGNNVYGLISSPYDRALNSNNP